MQRVIDVASAFALSVARLGAGLKAGPLGKRPEQLLELYEFEACPFCRKVREALTYLDLEARCLPLPQGGADLSAEGRGRGGEDTVSLSEGPEHRGEHVRIG